MARLAVVTALLLVPVIAVWVTVSSLLRRWVDVAAVLSHILNQHTRPLHFLGSPDLGTEKAYLVGVGELEIGLLSVGQGCPDLGELWAWACGDGDDGSGERAGRDNAPGKHAEGNCERVFEAIDGVRSVRGGANAGDQCGFVGLLAWCVVRDELSCGTPAGLGGQKWVHLVFLLGRRPPPETTILLLR